MENVFTLASAPRVEVIRALQDAVAVCAREAAEDVGIVGVQQFFSGYKNTRESHLAAA